MRIITLTFMFSLWMPLAANCQSTADELFNTKNVVDGYQSNNPQLKHVYQTYAYGELSGFETYQLFLPDSAKKIYCFPSNVQLTSDILVNNVVGIELGNAKTRNDYDQVAGQPFIVTALSTLNDFFPCK